jgi:hypothetical protein
LKKLGLRVGEKHLLEILDQNIGGNPLFLNAACFDVAKFKHILNQTQNKLSFVKEKKML